MFREFEKREALQRYLNGEKVSVMYDETLTAESPTYTVEPLDDMGHTRGCNAIECDKYVKGKPLKKRKDSGAKMVNEDPKERVEEVK